MGLLEKSYVWVIPDAPNITIARAIHFSSLFAIANAKVM